MNEDQRLHLQFIQNVITRMNANSFQVKTWKVSIIVALAALAVNSKNYMYILISVVPTILFGHWIPTICNKKGSFGGCIKMSC